MSTRGIVVAPNITLSPERDRIVSADLDPQYLRFCALYWDMIDIPVPMNNDARAFFQASRRDLDELWQGACLLKSHGFLVRVAGEPGSDGFTQMTLFGKPVEPDFFQTAQQAVYLSNNRLKNNTWTMGRPGRTFTLPGPQPSNRGFLRSTSLHLGGWNGTKPVVDVRNPIGPNTTILPNSTGEIELGLCAEIELFDSLPIPSASTQVGDILEFKRSRSDELMRFRQAMDSLYRRVLDSNDPLRSLEHAKAEIQTSLNELYRVMTESKLQPVISSMKSLLSLDLRTVGLAIGSIIDVASGGHHSSELLTGLLFHVASKININIRELLRPRTVPTELRDYAYLYQIQKNLVTSAPR